VGFRQITELDPWETTQLGPIKVTALPGSHGVPEITYMLQANDFTIYFGGDTRLIPALREIPQRFPTLDLALLPINGLMIRPAFNRKDVMSAQDAADLCAMSHPRVAIPIHYTFTGGPLMDRLLLKYNGTPEEFSAAVAQRAPETRVKVLVPGEPFVLTAASA
jgi:L-ascorbate metabolism protein UlaG (beta-lactamase superfamily)